MNPAEEEILSNAMVKLHASEALLEIEADLLLQSGWARDKFQELNHRGQKSILPDRDYKLMQNLYDFLKGNYPVLKGGYDDHA